MTIMVSVVGAWWDFAEQNNQANLLQNNETLNLHPLYGIKEKGSDHISYFEQNRTLREQYFDLGDADMDVSEEIATCADAPCLAQTCYSRGPGCSRF